MVSRAISSFLFFTTKMFSAFFFFFPKCVVVKEDDKDPTTATTHKTTKQGQLHSFDTDSFFLSSFIVVDVVVGRERRDRP